MTEIKFKENCNFLNKTYEVDDVFNKKSINLKTLPLIWKLNEKGFIYPITYDEYKEIENELKNKGKKVDVDGTTI